MLILIHLEIKNLNCNLEATLWNHGRINVFLLPGKLSRILVAL